MMKKIFFLLFLFPALTTIAQTDTITLEKKKKPSVATIITMDEKKVYGWFYKMDSNNVYLLPIEIKKPQLMEIKNNASNEAGIRVEAIRIDKITLKKKNGSLKGALIGLGCDAAMGALIGFASGDDPPGWFSYTAAEKAGGLAVFGGLTGALVGALIGAFAKETFIIGGKKDAYNDAHNKLAQRLNVQ